MENVSPIDCFAPEAQEFETDGIHLTEESGVIFNAYFINWPPFVSL